MMRVHPRGGEQRGRIRAGELDGSGAALQRGTGNDHLQHAMAARSLDHIRAVGVKTVMREVGADVDPLLHGATVMPDGVA